MLIDVQNRGRPTREELKLNGYDFPSDQPLPWDARRAEAAARETKMDTQPVDNPAATGGDNPPAETKRVQKTPSPPQPPAPPPGTETKGATGALPSDFPHADLLLASGVETFEALRERASRPDGEKGDLMELPGIGETRAREIREALALADAKAAAAPPPA